ncbi:methyltransferase [Streptomyces abyssalis]|uniref:Methyltransferase n=1 Tax=Streptomyces abyssalis TaxID=933944 RepID=A0A1E7JQ46_9ACTN|nr:class I SAM-dependent methyltransferase [Streptomyces abyssalis]OEU90412.1 methyltransferase [Streptomyces abyssalis]OEU95148.1 methyltransferase [Streptomyces abyssalis]
MVDRLFSDPGLAELYDTLCAGPLRAARDDFGFYLPYVMSASTVLDIGCGTGELLHMARESGHTGRLCGLDPAEAMLGQARRRRPDVEWVLGEPGSAGWQGEFELVVMTGHAFQVFVEDEQLRSSLAAIRTALTADGRFAFETRNPAARAWEHWVPENEVELADPRGGVLRSRHEAEPPVGDTVTFRQTLTGPRWDVPQSSVSTLRFLGEGELSSFLSEAGLTAAEQFGDWDGRPLTDDSPEIITIAVRS